MTYRDLLDFKDKRIVEEIYKRYKKEDNEELDKVYQEIVNNDQTKVQTVQYQYQQIMDKVTEATNLIFMFIFTILFIVLGAFVLACFLSFVNVAMMDSLQSVYQFFCQIGVYFNDHFFHIALKELLVDSNELNNTMALYIIGMAMTLIFIFTGLLIYSFFKKDKKIKKELELTVKDSYHYLGCHEDDDWNYIKNCLERKLKKRRHKQFFERYYLSYICIFDHYSQIEGNIKDLQRKSQIKLCFFTCTNTIKNILGSFSKPLFFSLVIMIAYCQNFTYTNLLTLEILLQALPFGNILWWLINQSYIIIMHIPLFSFLHVFSLEFSKVLSLCICYTIIAFVWDVAYNKLRESRRQYHRRLNFYLKKQNNIYEEKKKYDKAYHYGIQFFVFVLMVVSCIGLKTLEVNYSSFSYFKINQSKEMQASLNSGEKVFTRIDKYATQHKQLFTRQTDYFNPLYICEGKLSLVEKDLKPYLEVYTYYNEEEAQSALMQYDLAQEKLKNDKKTKIQYIYNKKGFIIKDKTTIIIMENQQQLNEKDIKTMMKQIGYKNIK